MRLGDFPEGIDSPVALGALGKLTALEVEECRLSEVSESLLDLMDRKLTSLESGI